MGDNPMKKFVEWLKSPRSDFLFFIILLVLANIAGHNAFLRFDMTAPKSYSLSRSSRELVRNLEQPLSVRVFFDSSLPSPYNSTAQYVKDMLVEYKGAANRNFSVTYMDMSKEKSRQLAGDYGLRQIQIQEVKNNEIGFKQVYMGLVLSYGDGIELLDAVTTSDGFEYKFTSTVSKMVSTADTLAGLASGDNISLTLYLSEPLKSMRISGADQAAEVVENAFRSVNRQNQDRLTFSSVSPSSAEAAALVDKYGLQGIQYKNSYGEYDTAVVGLVLEHGDNFRVLPVYVQNVLFGYALSGLEGLEDTINKSLQSLLSNVQEIGYIVGHNELDVTNERQAANFDKLVSGMYSLVEINLAEEDIPAGMNSIIINGPQTDFSDAELYKIDQFVMRGGNVMFFVDSFLEDKVSGGGYYQMPSYIANDNTLDKLLNAYGVKRNFDIVMDKQCYESSNSQYGKLSMYWVPVLQKNQLARKNVITDNLGYVIMLQNGSIDVSEAEAAKDVSVTVLARSSDESWTETENIMLNPVMLNPPQADELRPYNLAVLLEGRFSSAFDKAPAADDGEGAAQGGDGDSSGILTDSHISSGVLPGKIFVTGSSYITTYQVLDDKGESPIGMFLMNVVDYLNGNADLCAMRTKGLSLNTLTLQNPVLAQIFKYFNQFGLVLIVAVAGLIVWRARTRRRNQIRLRYNPDDRREFSSKREEPVNDGE